MITHNATCRCSACENEREFRQLTSELLPEFEVPVESRGERIVSYIKEALCWAAVVGCILVMLRCAQ